MGHNYLTNMIESWRFQEASGTPVGEVTGHTLAFVNGTPGVTEGPDGGNAIIFESGTGYCQVNGSAAEPWDLRTNPAQSYTVVSRYYIETEMAAPDGQFQMIAEQSDGNPNEGFFFRNDAQAPGFRRVHSNYDTSQVIHHAISSTVIAEKVWQTSFATFDADSGVLGIRGPSDASTYTGACSNLNWQSIVDLNIGTWNASGDPDHFLQGRMAEFTYWKGRVLTDAEMEDYINDGERVPFSSLGDWPPSPPETFPDISALQGRHFVPIATSVPMLPKGQAGGLLHNAHLQNYDTSLELQTSSPCACTVLYRLVKNADDR